MSAAERFSRLFARRRHVFALVIAAITVFFAWQMRHLEIYTAFLDLLPRDHPWIQTYEDYREVFGNANTVVVAVAAREGDIYQAEVLRAIERATELLDSSVVDPEVNALPASAYVSPHGPVERGVHALVAFVDRLFRSQAPVEGETGVDHNVVASLMHRSVRDPRVDAEGVLRSPPVVGSIPESEAEWDALRTRVRRNPTVFGVLVSTDETAALARASFVESRLDYGALFKHLRQLEATVEAEYPVEVHVTGQPVLFGWTYAFATEILLIFALTLIVSVVLLWAWFRRWYGVFLPISGAAVNVIWGLGFAGWAGFHLDPLVLVVPMLITARAISHSVQFVERFYEEYERLGDKDEACIVSMTELLLPGTLAILTDCVGLLTISLATIPLMRDLGMLCAFWAASIGVTEMLLNRLVILYLPAPRERMHQVPKWSERLLGGAAGLVRTRAGAAGVTLAFAVAALASWGLARGVPVGDLRPGSPLLWPDSDYNVAAAEIAERFYGLEDLLVIAHAREPGRIYAPDAFKQVETLQRVLETDPSAGGSVSFVDLMKETSRLFHDNDPRWAMWMQNTTEILGLSFMMESSVPAPGVLDAYRAQSGQDLSVRVFYADHQDETLRRVSDLVRRYTESERFDGSLAIRLEPAEGAGLGDRLRAALPFLSPPAPALVVSVPGANGERRALPVESGLDEPAPAGDGRVLARFRGQGVTAELRDEGRGGGHRLYVDAGAGFAPAPDGVWLRDGIHFRLAAGSMGVAAAASEEVERSHTLGVAVVFLATFLIISLSYRSLVVGLLLLASLGTAALAAMATQRLAGIAINVNTLPVHAIGVGIGVDYAIYVVDRILQERARGLGHSEAITHAIRTTGLAIGFTASTLLVGIVFWIPISSLRFSADMSLLLSVLMTVNALGAILLVPALIRLLPERWSARLGTAHGDPGAVTGAANAAPGPAPESR